MAIEKVIDIKVQGNVDQAVGSLRSQLRQAQADVAELSNKFGATSQAAVDAAKKAGELKDRIGDAKALTDAFNPDAKFRSLTASLSGVAGGFAAYQGALNLAGVENKNLEESLLKVQSAMALSQGLQALGESRDSFKQLKTVAVDALKGIKAGIGATGIGLLVVTLGLIVANWDAIVKSVKEAFPAFENIGEIFNKLKQYAFGAGEVIKNYILMPFKALGQLISGDFTGAIEEIKKGFDVLGNFEKGASKERQSQRDAAAAEQLAKIIKDNENRIAVLKAAGKDTYNLELENLKNKQKLYADDQEKLDQALQDERVLRASHGKQVSDKQKANALEREKIAKEEAEKLLKLQEDLAKTKREKQIEEGYKAQEDIEAATKANADRLLTEQELATQNENEAYKIKYDNAIKNGNDTTELEIQHLNNINDINLTAQQKQYATDKEISDAKIKLTEAEAAAKQALFAKTASVLSKGADLLGKNTAASKAMAIAAATINTYQGITAELATKTVTPWEIGLKIANVAIIAATGFKAVQDIVSVKIPGGGGGGGGGSAPSMGGTMAPQFNVVGATGVNQLAGVMGAQQQTPVQAYVVANNVTTAQSLDRNIIQSATLGG